MNTGKTYRYSLPIVTTLVAPVELPLTEKRPINLIDKKTMPKPIHSINFFSESGLSFARAFATNFAQSFTQDSLLKSKFSNFAVASIVSDTVQVLATWGVFNAQAAVLNIGVSALKNTLIYCGANKNLVNYSARILSLGLSLYSIGSMASLALFALSFVSGMAGGQLGNYAGSKLAMVLFHRSPEGSAKAPADKGTEREALIYRAA